MNNTLIQQHVNKVYEHCETLKDQLALLNAKYKASVAYLDTICISNKISPSLNEGVQETSVIPNVEHNQ